MKKLKENGYLKTVQKSKTLSSPKLNAVQQHIKTMLKPVSNRNSVFACSADCPCGQSRSPARTVFIRDVVQHKDNQRLKQ